MITSGSIRKRDTADGKSWQICIELPSDPLLKKRKHKDFEIRLENCHLLKLSKEVMQMAESDSDLLNAVYREISEKLGMDTAMEIYQMFKGQQINFPVRFFNPARIQQIIVKEYDGTNVRTLAIKYNYSEKTVRRIIKDSLEE